jgi:hypothetical protein
MERTSLTTLTHTKSGLERVMEILDSPFLVPIREVKRELEISIYVREEELSSPTLLLNKSD